MIIGTAELLKIFGLQPELQTGRYLQARTWPEPEPEFVSNAKSDMKKK